MRQDSQTFSDIMDIETADQLCVELAVTTEDDPFYDIRINGIKAQPKQYLDLMSEIRIDFKKSQRGLVMLKLSVNGREILPQLRHLLDCEDDCIEAARAWHLSISPNFHSWYHTVDSQGWIA